MVCSGYFAVIRTSAGMYDAFCLAASFIYPNAKLASLMVMTGAGESPAISGCFTDERTYGV
jgi:hypothetical protein